MDGILIMLVYESDKTELNVGCQPQDKNDCPNHVIMHSIIVVIAMLSCNFLFCC